jgi:hypothetical protein
MAQNESSIDAIVDIDVDIIIDADVIVVINDKFDAKTQNKS